MLYRVFGVSAGAQLALLVSGLLAQTGARGFTPAAAANPQQVATVMTVRFGLFALFAVLGSGAWALSRPPGLRPYFTTEARYPTMRMMFTGFAWGMFMVAVGAWRGWSQELTTAAVFLASLSWEFMMITIVWIGNRMSSNPIQFWQDLKAGRELRARGVVDAAVAEAHRVDADNRREGDGGLH